MTRSETPGSGRKGPRGMVKGTPGVTVGVWRLVPVGDGEGTRVADGLDAGATMTVNAVVYGAPAAFNAHS